MNLKDFHNCLTRALAKAHDPEYCQVFIAVGETQYEIKSVGQFSIVQDVVITVKEDE